MNEIKLTNQIKHEKCEKPPGTLFQATDFFVFLAKIILFCSF